ncbi:MAG: DUF4360 domain-containing protein [Candidatus Electrothrix sp. GM3_4]|nr:DUF4360 domain-containing protein [Candidatus Electrothrix sp. GM3_4]
MTLFAGQTFAARPSVYFKAPMKFRGTGCPGLNSVTVSGENTDTMTIMFDQFDAAKPKDNAASGMMRTSCNFAVPVHVPDGFQVSNLTADWRGYAEGKTKLRREYFFAGQRGPSKTSNPKGDFVLTDELMHATWSGCKGRDVPMRINSSVQAKSKDSYIAVDTVDLKNKIVFRLKWKACQ